MEQAPPRTNVPPHLLQRSAKKELLEEVIGLRDSLHRAAVTAMRTQKDLQQYKVKTRKLKDVIRKKDATIRQLRLQNDAQMRDIASSLLLLQAKLKKDQSKFESLLSDKDKVIQSQTVELLRLRQSNGSRDETESPVHIMSEKDEHQATVQEDSGLENSGEGDGLSSAPNSLPREVKSVHFYLKTNTHSSTSSLNRYRKDMNDQSTSSDSATSSLERPVRHGRSGSIDSILSDNPKKGHRRTGSDEVTYTSILKRRSKYNTVNSDDSGFVGGDDEPKENCIWFDGQHADRLMAKPEKEVALQSEDIRAAKLMYRDSIADDYEIKNRYTSGRVLSDETEGDERHPNAVRNFEPGLANFKSVKTVREVKNKNRGRPRGKMLHGSAEELSRTKNAMEAIQVHYV